LHTLGQEALRADELVLCKGALQTLEKTRLVVFGLDRRRDTRSHLSGKKRGRRDAIGQSDEEVRGEEKKRCDCNKMR
jgi:hypothetical protein